MVKMNKKKFDAFNSCVDTRVACVLKKGMSDDKFYTSVLDAEMPLKLLQYNVDQAMREEKHEETKWVNRRDRIRDLINEVNADVVTLQEFRSLPGVDETPEQFLASFAQYRFVIDYRNSQPLAFGQAILWKPTKFYCVETAKRWLSDTPTIPSDTWSTAAAGTTGFGTILNGVRLVPVNQTDGKIIGRNNAFWVFNAHFALDEKVKTESCHSVLRSMDEIARGESFTFSGVLNFFPDRDGAKQRAILTNFPLQDLGASSVTLQGQQIGGTFIGFEHDEFKADLRNMISRLDHIFLGGAKQQIKSTHAPLLVYNKTMLPEEPAPFTTRMYPSDHLPLVADLQLTLLE